MLPSSLHEKLLIVGADWRRGRESDSDPRGPGFDPQPGHGSSQFHSSWGNGQKLIDSVHSKKKTKKKNLKTSILLYFLQSYKPRWGYKRAGDDTKDWVIEVPQNAGIVCQQCIVMYIMSCNLNYCWQ